MGALPKALPNTRFVKAFSCVGNAFMVNPDFGGQKPTMFICGNDDAAKRQVTDVYPSLAGTRGHGRRRSGAGD